MKSSYNSSTQHYNSALLTDEAIKTVWTDVIIMHGLYFQTVVTIHGMHTETNTTGTRTIFVNVSVAWCECMTPMAFCLLRVHA